MHWQFLYLGFLFKWDQHAVTDHPRLHLALIQELIDELDADMPDFHPAVLNLFDEFLDPERNILWNYFQPFDLLEHFLYSLEKLGLENYHAVAHDKHDNVFELPQELFFVHSFEFDVDFVEFVDFVRILQVFCLFGDD